jgi:nicotinate-nucleotide adenylyltransferase
VTPDAGDLWGGARIGVLGGTFDPPHRGHVRMGAVARDVLGLDRVLFSPAAHPPHKPDSETTAYHHRVAMLEAAVAGEDRLVVARLEEANAPSYTVSLLRACRERTRADLYFVMGADSLVDLPTWKDPGEILRLATLVVFAREKASLVLPVDGDASVVVFEEPLIDVSSTEVRAAIERGEIATEQIPPSVAAYIARNRLYRRD